jgi:hypothetical protein
VLSQVHDENEARRPVHAGKSLGERHERQAFPELKGGSSRTSTNTRDLVMAAGFLLSKSSVAFNLPQTLDRACLTVFVEYLY